MTLSCHISVTYACKEIVQNVGLNLVRIKFQKQIYDQDRKHHEPKETSQAAIENAR